MSKVLPLARLPIPLNFKGGSGAGSWKKNEATVGISSMWPRCSWAFWVKCWPRRWTWTFSGTGAVGGKGSKAEDYFLHIQKKHIWFHMNAEYIIYMYVFWEISDGYIYIYISFSSQIHHFNYYFCSWKCFTKHILLALPGYPPRPPLQGFPSSVHLAELTHGNLGVKEIPTRWCSQTMAYYGWAFIVEYCVFFVVYEFLPV